MQWYFEFRFRNPLILEILFVNPNRSQAKVAELADALVLGASGATRGSSSLPFRTTER